MITETLCEKDDEPDIQGYTIKSPKEKRNKNWGGIMFAIRDEFANQVQIKSENTEVAEILFMQIICGHEKLTLGLVYAPQENQTTVEEINDMYKYIEDEISRAKMENHVLILGGDFNCKIGEIIKGNKKEITKGGRRLLKLARNNELKIINTSEKCNGIWTRIST